MATTKYRVLRKRGPQGVTGPTMAAPSPGTAASPGAAAAAPDAFEVLYRNVEASSADQAIRLALADEKDAAGVYAAVPERYWTQHTIGREPQPDRLVFS